MKNMYLLSPHFLVPNFSHNDTALHLESLYFGFKSHLVYVSWEKLVPNFSHYIVFHLESLYFGFGSPFAPCFMKNRVPTGSLFIDSRYPVLVTMVQLQLFFWFIQKFRFIQCKNLNIDSKTYSSISFSAKIQFKVLFKTWFSRKNQFNKIFKT